MPPRHEWADFGQLSIDETCERQRVGFAVNDFCAEDRFVVPCSSPRDERFGAWSRPHLESYDSLEPVTNAFLIVYRIQRSEFNPINARKNGIQVAQSG